MKGPGTADACGAEARRTLARARFLLAAGDDEGACHRAYHATFHVALFAVGLGEAAMAAKTHSGFNSLLHDEIVETGRLAVEVGKALDQNEQLRLPSD